MCSFVARFVRKIWLLEYREMRDSSIIEKSPVVVEELNENQFNFWLRRASRLGSDKHNVIGVLASLSW